MQVKLLFFAAARDAARQSEVLVQLPAEVGDVQALTLWLGDEYPELSPYLASIRIAQNEQFVEASSVIREGDVLAVIPPVAGG
ncbi:MAG TPA: molybdopterin converting factor subunit 1 [Polyangiaceae bacterium]